MLARRLGFAANARRDESLIAFARAEMHRLGEPSAERYLDHLEAESDAIAPLIAHYVVGETYFFRDSAQCLTLRDFILPAIVAARPPGHRVMAWSAGCSSGEEPYTLACLADEARLGARVAVLGTDVSSAALARAAIADYSAWSLRGIDDTRRALYFSTRGHRFLLAERIRSRVTFARHNLVTSPYPAAGSLDLILCRNVLIYFDATVVLKVLSRLVETLAPGGWLVLGACDALIPGALGLESVMTPSGLVYRKPLATASRPLDPVTPAPGSVRETTSTTAGPPPVVGLSIEPPPRPPRPARPSPPPARTHASTRGDNARSTAESVANALRRRADEHGPGAIDDPIDAALEQWPAAGDLWLLRALVSLDRAEYDAAEEALGRLHYLDPTHLVGRMTLGLVHTLQGRLEDARRCYRLAIARAAARPPDEPVAGAENLRSADVVHAAEEAVRSLSFDVRRTRRGTDSLGTTPWETPT
jgi:chemotaxis protein methyltransferase CheR